MLGFPRTCPSFIYIFSSGSWLMLTWYDWVDKLKCRNLHEALIKAGTNLVYMPCWRAYFSTGLWWWNTSLYSLLFPQTFVVHQLIEAIWMFWSHQLRANTQTLGSCFSSSRLSIQKHNIRIKRHLRRQPAFVWECELPPVISAQWQPEQIRWVDSSEITIDSTSSPEAVKEMGGLSGGPWINNH